MKHSIINKIFVGFCITFLLATLIGSIVCFAETVIPSHSLINGSLLKKSNGIVSLVAQSNRDTDYLDMTSYGSGTLTITMGTAGYGAVVVSQDDLPQDIDIGYNFITNDFHSINNVTTVSVSIPGNCYVYVSYNKSYTATFEPSTPVDPTPSTSPIPTPTDNPTPTGTVSPTPVPTGSPESSGIYFHFDVPLDYYFIIIIILMGGILICQLFKN